jgi:6-phosphogluconolactonase
LSRGIYVSRLDADTGKLSDPELAAETPSPCYLAVSPDKKILYAANNLVDLNGGKTGAVSAFALDLKSGHLALMDQKSTGGPGTCHVSADAAGKVLLAANYADGSVKSFQLNQDGSIGPDGSYIKRHGSSVNTNRQTSAHAHFIHADPAGRFALACDLGTDTVVIYRINSTTGALEENSSAAVPPGSGARHLVFSLDGKFVHVINEMGCTVTTFAWDSEAGKLTPVETVSALPPGEKAQPAFTAAEILTAGDYVYATLRGPDSVTVFAADPQTGRLTFLQNISCGGKVPRGLGIDPTGHWLITGNQKSDNVVEFTIDPATGKISPTGQELKIGSPVDVEFVPKN